MCGFVESRCLQIFPSSSSEAANGFILPCLTRCYQWTKVQRLVTFRLGDESKKEGVRSRRSSRHVREKLFAPCATVAPPPSHPSRLTGGGSTSALEVNHPCKSQCGELPRVSEGSQMPRHLISDAHEWINEIPTVPTYLAKAQPRERAWDNQRGKKTLLSLTLVRLCEMT